MALTPGTRLGPYEVLAAIGAGGMGEVYRARDGTLHRDVALKILPEPFALDADRLARFRREAQVLAALNHPNIAAIYGFEESTSVHALVLELVEGPTLADRIAQGAMPLDEVLPIARQIAEALEAAHEQGIIHRDLKPANIKLRPDGTVKVLDFGLAKALDPTPAAGATDPAYVRGVGRDFSPAALSQSPTLTSPAMMTGVGMILGTAAYMSPEQARGKPVDKRADIWAFGCVLYEMLTGQRAFPGEDVTDTLAAVVRAEPAWDAVPRGVPPGVRVFLRRCLQKDPKQRVGDIHDVRLALEGAFETDGPGDAGGARSLSWQRRVLPFAVGVLLGGVVTGGLAWRGRPVALSPRVIRSVITIPADLPISSGSSVAFSPDGATVAVSAGNQLVLRRLDREELTTVPGTAGATGPIFSPDGNWVGFSAGGQLRKVRIDGTNPVTISPMPSGTPVGFQGWWGSDDQIWFSAGAANGLFRAPAAGGMAAQVTEPNRAEGEIGHTLPQLLPDGRTVLFTVSRSDAPTAALLSLDTGTWRPLPQVKGGARYVDSGHLVFRDRDTLFAVRFNPNTGAVLGTPAPVVDGLREGTFATSADGTLAFVPNTVGPANLGTLALVDRTGALSDYRADPASLEGFDALQFAPDGRRFAASVRGPDGAHIWVYDTSRGNRRRLTDGGNTNTSPLWTRDGKALAFNSTRASQGLYLQAVDGVGGAQLLLPRGPGPQAPRAWSADGRTLIYVELNSRTSSDVWTLSGDGKTSALLTTPANEGSPRLSPDGRWLAYESDRSGQFEVYVQSFPTAGGVQVVSVDGGRSPRWAGDGELVFRRDNQVATVSVKNGETLTLGQPAVLFEGAYDIGHFDVSPDGQTFLTFRRAAPSGVGQINLVQNWFEELKRLVPVN